MFIYSADTFFKAAFRKTLCLVVGIAFISTSIVSPAYAQTVFNLPLPGQMVELSGAFAPVVLKGVTIHPEDPLLFDFIVDNGQAGLQGQALTDETTRLVKYFLTGLAVPEKDLWVNLSPVEKDRIMVDDLSHTDVGRDMLAQDYMLKQITASVLYPEEAIGKDFWNKVYAQAQKRFGTTDIPVDTFNKVWIVPEKAVVYENKDSAYVVESKLKVMLETDYNAIRHSEPQESVILNEAKRSEGSQHSLVGVNDDTAQITQRSFVAKDAPQDDGEI